MPTAGNVGETVGISGCLAQSMEEDVNLCSEIYYWALGRNDMKNQLPNLLELKRLLWQAMDHRAAVSHHCCAQLISIFHDHSVWQRERSSSFLECHFWKRIQNPTVKGREAKKNKEDERKIF